MNVIQGGPTPVVSPTAEALGQKRIAEEREPFVPVKAAPKSEASGKYTTGKEAQNDLRGRKVDLEA